MEAMSFLRLDSLVQLGMGFFLVGVENKLGQKWGGRSPPKPLEILEYTFLRGWAKNPNLRRLQQRIEDLAWAEEKLIWLWQASRAEGPMPPVAVGEG